MKDPLETEERVETRSAMWVMALAFASLVLLVLLRPSLAVTVALIVGLVFTVMLHEAGHMIVAKRSGMKVTEFFVGFGPRIWSFRRGETEYGIKAIPAGGYVRIIGMNSIEEVDPEDEPRTYRAASFPKRLATILAGIGVNLLIAFVLIFLVLVRVGETRLRPRRSARCRRACPQRRPGSGAVTDSSRSVACPSSRSPT